MASGVERRLKEREEARKIALEQSKVEKEEEKNKEETHEYFSAQFLELKQEIDDMLLNASSQGDIKQHFNEIGQKLQTLQKLLSDSSLYLPRYNIRMSQECKISLFHLKKLNELKTAIQTKQDELLPRKKFAFHSRKKTVPQQQTKEDNTVPTPSPPSNTAVTQPSPAVSTGIKASTHNMMDIRDKSSTTLSLTPRDGYDVCLTNIDSCKVEITGSPGTLHISNIRNTQLLCGPVKGSVFIEVCTECQMAIACQQLRIHSTTRTDFYLHVTSKAIIEDTNTVRFAPYNFNYPEITTHYKCSGLSTDVNNWNQVDDFNWLTSKQQSPNWSILPEESRLQEWTRVPQTLSTS